MENLITHLMLHNSAEALLFYSKLLNCDISDIHYSDGSVLLATQHHNSIPLDNNQIIMHSALMKNNKPILYIATAHLQDANYQGHEIVKTTFGNSISLILELSQQEELNTRFDMIKNHGDHQISISPTETYWGDYYAIIRDKHHTIWQLRCPLK